MTKTNKDFDAVADSVNRISNLIAEISAASAEQAAGIAQVNHAVTEMNKVTQQNAANAKESSSASEELYSQAVQMKKIVRDLVTLVEGSPNRKQKLDTSNL